MALSAEQARNILKSPKNSQAIQEAVNHEARIKLHTKAVDNSQKASPYYQTFLQWVEQGVQLPADKMAQFREMCIFPLPTTSLCNAIFDEYEKIFTAQDAFCDIELTDENKKQELKAYLHKLDIAGYFRTKGFQDFKTQPNCIYVVDMPSSDQTPEATEPYFYKVPVTALVDIGVKVNTSNKEAIDYLAYKIHGDKYVVICDGFYRLFQKIKKDNNEIDYELIGESTHDLGYAPAAFFSDTLLYGEEDGNLVARKIPLSDSLGDLDWLLFYKIAERMYETYGPFPIMTIPDEECDFTDHQTQSPCQSGVVQGINGDGTTRTYRCPACKERSNLVGPGSIFKKFVPQDKEDVDPGDLVKIYPADVKSLEYITKKIDLLEWAIYENCVGGGDEVQKTEAINQSQVQNSTEGKRNVLLRIKRPFESAPKFITDTIGRLKYGNAYVGSTHNLGEQFLLYTAKDLRDQLKEFKSGGLPTHMVNSKRLQLAQAEYRNNPYMLKRFAILDALEPWPDNSIAEAIQLGLNKLQAEKFYLKLDLAKIISKFERINGDIVHWGKELPFDDKITKITTIIEKYVERPTDQQIAALNDTASNQPGNELRKQQQ